MNLKIAFACAVFLPCAVLAQSDFSLSTTATPRLEDAIQPLPDPLGDTFVRSEIDLAQPKMPNPEDVLKQVVNDLKTKDYVAALPKLEYLQSFRPSEPDILILRGCIYNESGHPESAEPLFKKAVDVAPAHPWARLNLAETQLILKKYADAEVSLTYLATARPESEVVRFKLILALAMQKKFPAAEQELQQLKDSAVTPAYYFAAAAMSFAKNDTGKAKDFIAQAQRVYTNSQTGYFLTALSAMGWVPKPS